MGRSVMVHPGAEATVYRTISNYHTFCNDCETEVDEYECPTCGADMYDHDGEVARDEYDMLVDWIREAFIDAFPSMCRVDYWAEGCGAMNELKCVVANELCEVYVSEYCGLASISVVPTGCAEYSRDTTGLARHWCAVNGSRVLDQFNEYKRIGTFSNGESVYQKVAQ